MAAQSTSIELLPQEDWEKGSLGKFLKWALTVGRYIIIVTELIVVLAFLFRFKLDRDLTDLNESIAGKQAEVKASTEFENNFRLLQKKLQVIKELRQSQLDTDAIFNELAAILPLDVKVTDLSVAMGTATFKATSLSEAGLSTFIKNIKASPVFSNLVLSQVTSDVEKGVGIQFELSSSLISKSL